MCNKMTKTPVWNVNKMTKPPSDMTDHTFSHFAQRGQVVAGVRGWPFNAMHRVAYMTSIDHAYGHSLFNEPLNWTNRVPIVAAVVAARVAVTRIEEEAPCIVV